MRNEQKGLCSANGILHRKVENSAHDISQRSGEFEERTAKILIVGPSRKCALLKSDTHFQEPGDVATGVPCQKEAGKQIAMAKPCPDDRKNVEILYWRCRAEKFGERLCSPFPYHQQYAYNERRAGKGIVVGAKGACKLREREGLPPCGEVNGPLLNMLDGIQRRGRT